uniref:Uncharacterized protein n=1 Tax=Tanacetum cinerariifolium TaxID=118510 RepID=A0A6L2KQC9_TANCI|nr:hypothetical protein [Tanacetum cinerariifolium]
MDEALVPHARRPRIERSNFRLLSDISSKESTLQLVTATVHHHSIRFKIENKKHIVNLESFREMLHICPRLSGQPFVEPLFEEEILAFLRFLGHSGAIRRLTDVNINKLHQPWRSFAAIINKCLTRKSSGYDSLRLNIKIQRRAMRCIILGPRLSTFAKDKQPAITSKHKSLSALSEVAMTKAQQLNLATKRSLQQAHISQASSFDTDEGTGTIPGVLDVPTEEFEEEISWESIDEGDDDDDDDDEDDDQEDKGNDEDDQEEGSDDEQASKEEEFIHPSLIIHDEEETRDEESFDPISKTPENTDNEGNGEENLEINVGREEGQDEEDEEDELYRDVNINLGRSVQMADVHTTQEFEDSHVTLTPVNLDGQQQSSSVSSQFVTTQTLTPSTITTVTTTQQAPTLPTTAPSTLLFGFDHRLKTLEANFSEFMQMNQFAGPVPFIPGIIIKEQVKEQVKVQVSKILPKIEQTVNEQLEAEVLTRSSNSSKTSYAVVADLSERELKKILIDKMKGNKSIHRSNEQRNLYKALVEAYKFDKIILDTYEDTIALKRRRDDDADKDEEPFAGSDQGSKRRREAKEPESTRAPKEKATRSAGKSTQGSKSQQTSASESATSEEPMKTTHEMEEPSHPEFETGANDQLIVESSQHPEWFSQQKKPPTLDRDWNKTFPATHGSIQLWISDLAKQTDFRSSFNELMDTPMDFSAFLMNRLKVDTLTSELLACLTYELMKGSCKILPLPLIPNSQGYHVIPFDHFINNDLEYLCGGASSRKYTTSVTKTKAADYGHIKWIEDLVPRTMWIQEPLGYDKHSLWGISYWGRKRQQFYGFAVNRESASDVYSKRRIIAVTELKIVEWHNYKHLDWITMRKLTNLTVEERFAFNISLRMFTRSIVIQRRVEDLQLGVESYQKKLNLTRPDTYRFDLKLKEAYTAYSNPRGFIYQNKDKQNKLMRIDELHKFSDGTLTDVRTALDDRLKGIRMKYLPQTI